MLFFYLNQDVVRGQFNQTYDKDNLKKVIFTNKDTISEEIVAIIFLKSLKLCDHMLDSPAREYPESVWEVWDDLI